MVDCRCGEINSFMGTFNGNFQEIKNLNSPIFESNAGTIKNLNVTGNINMTTVGTNLLNYATQSNYNLDNNAIVQKCMMQNNLGLNCIGGIVNCNTGKIENCTSNININVHVKENDMFRENMSFNQSNNYDVSLLTGDDSSSRIMGEGSNYLYIGGIVGVSSGEITKCINKGNITVTTEIDNDFCVGGIVGGSNCDLQINNCSNYGNIKVPNSHPKDHNKRNLSRHLYNINECQNTGNLVWTLTNNDVCSLIGGIKGTIIASEELAELVNSRDALVLCGLAMEDIEQIQGKLEGLLSKGINENNLTTAISEINQIAQNTNLNGLKLLDGSRESINLQISANGFLLLNLPNLTATGLSLTTASTAEDINNAIETVKGQYKYFETSTNKLISRMKAIEEELAQLSAVE